MLAMPADKPGRVFTANDGGVDVSEDSGRTWSNRSAGLSVTMYYDSTSRRATSTGSGAAHRTTAP